LRVNIRVRVRITDLRESAPVTERELEGGLERLEAGRRVAFVRLGVTVWVWVWGWGNGLGWGNGSGSGSGQGLGLGGVSVRVRARAGANPRLGLILG
jgi:hypothetical protein